MGKTFSNLEVSESKPFENYTYTERRAFIWRLFLKRGPAGVSNNELADKFGVSPGQISHDKKILGKWAEENLEEDVAFFTKLGLEKALRDLYDEDWGEYRRWLQFLWNLLPSDGLEVGLPENFEEEAEERGYIPKEEAVNVSITSVGEAKE